MILSNSVCTFSIFDSNGLIVIKPEVRLVKDLNGLKGDFNVI